MKDALFVALQQCLSPDKIERQTAEQKIKTLELTDDFPIHLTEIIVQADAPLGFRQLCCVLLKQYVLSHWSKDGEKFAPPETPIHVKNIVRSTLPTGLNESLSLVRSGTSCVMAAIAHFDWPDSWPDLFDLLTRNLASGDSNRIHGTMRVLVEFSHDISDKQIETLAPILLPACLKIFTENQVHSVRTRSRAVELFSTLCGIIYFVYEYDKSVGKRLLFDLLPAFGEAFAVALRLPDDKVNSDSAIKAEIIKAVANLIERFPKQSHGFMPHILPSIWSIFSDIAMQYVRTEIQGEKDEEDNVDSEGDSLGLNKLIFSLLEIIDCMIEQKVYAQNVLDNLPDLVYLLLVYMQIPEEKVEEWSFSAEKYIEDEDEESTISSVRSAALDLILSLSEKWPNETAKSLLLAVGRHVQESETRKTNYAHWWKAQETCFMALGSTSSALIDFCANSPKDQADLQNFMTSHLFTALQSQETIFLQGQALWFVSRVASCCTREMLMQTIGICSQALSPSQCCITKCMAARALYNIFDYLKNRDDCRIIEPHLNDIINNLIAFGLKGKETTLNLALSTLSVCTEAPLSIGEAACLKVLSLSTAAMLKYSGDPMIPEYVSSIAKSLVSSESYCTLVLQKMLPTLLSIVRNSQTSMPLRLQSVCLEILESLVRGYPGSFPAILVDDAFPAAAQCMLRTDDAHTLQTGRECIRAFVSRAPEKIINWTDGSSNTGISLLIQIICRLLDPSTPELSASMVGRLVFVLLKKADQALAPYLEQVLHAVLNKMQHSELPAVHQSLIMVFAHLIHYHTEAVLTFLSTVHSSDGKSALEFVFRLWCNKQKEFFGAYDQKISALALCKVLLCMLSKKDDTLLSIFVPDEMPIAQERSGYNLRSKGPACETRQVPLLVKLYKLIVYELGTQLESKEDALNSSFLEDELEGENENDSDSAGHKTDLSDILSGIVNDLEDSDQYSDDDDPDLCEDPRSHLNLKQELIEFLSQFARQSYFNQFIEFATQKEIEILRKSNVIQ